MQQELRRLELDVLDSMHREAHAHLQACLHRGATNDEITAQRQILGELGIAINSKLRHYLRLPSEARHSRRENQPPLLHC